MPRSCSGTTSGRTTAFTTATVPTQLRKYESAGKVAMNAGHSEGTLYKHYLKAVTKAEAEAFWKIFPEETLKAAA